MPQRAAAVLIRGKNILLMRRVKNGEEYFVFPGGLVESGESPEKAVIREIQEEFGLHIENPRFLFEMESMGKQGYYYLVKDFAGEPVLGGEELSFMTEHNQYHPAWKGIAEIRNIPNLYPVEVRDKVADILDQNNLART